MLAPEPSSAGAARRLVREVLREADRSEWADAGELAVSEVVTNATLHAHTEIVVHVAAYVDELCVEVSDRSGLLPRQRAYSDADGATTGRGLALVAAVSRSCGVRRLDGGGGKVVWFCVGGDDGDGDGQVAVDPAAGETALATWSDVDDELPAGTAATRTVTLRSMPATLWLGAVQHHDTLLRELVLHLADHQIPGVDFAAADRARAIVTRRLLSAIEEARRHGLVRPPVPDGHPTPLPWVPHHLDLVLQVDPAEASTFAGLQDVLDLAEALADAGELLARPGLPEVIAVRDWACEQVISQLAGATPLAWPGTADERFEVAPAGVDVAAPEEELVAVTATDACIVAADDANRIVAVSAHMAELVGWAPGDLVGRRVVVLIPPQLREAHVAGFSRHLSTGVSHIIGVPLELPVLHREGHELRCRLTLDQRTTRANRNLYLATIEPVAPSPAERSDPALDVADPAGGDGGTGVGR